ncbi:sigma-70 family RNA polymerase sigma factor [Arthrobacter sp. AK01]|uniref:RNA polymerase sigma factor n=1 Tax=Micrococcaceae TaxID=1268 RepID=UPI001E553A26|nr:MULTISPECIES: sigma-70 family RNA polymerase sigma factor [Micrococcaceae]MCD4853098.1 sigma-70 family RNA polymerase sigma factor [Arthrobacter sp. AK01]MCP1411259.1 RNA polymerase sigma-70 factor (ECF subfamily) [Paenarthrobacter sp. A20]
MLDPMADEYVQADRDDPALLFTAAYNSFAGPVFGYLRARGVDDPEAVTQDVFLALYPRLEALHGGLQGAKTLLFSIAHARMVDHYRKRERTPDSTPYESELDSRRASSAEDEAFGRAFGVGVTELLDDLTDDYREVLALRVVADLSVEETAGIMGKSQGAVKQLQRRALSALKKRALRTNGTS